MTHLTYLEAAVVGLATPVILAAGALKIPDLLGPLGNGIRGQIVLGSVLSGLGGYLSVRFLLRYLRTRTIPRSGSTASSRAWPASPTSAW